MALITLDPSEIPGKHLVEGQDMINLATAVNALAAGTQPITSGNFSGNVVVGGFIDHSTATGLTAVGTNRATALQLSKELNNVTTAASGTGVILPDIGTAGVGAIVRIFNNGANPIKVYGVGSQTIDGTAGATGVTLTNALRCQYYAFSATVWLSAQMGVASA